jgi:hypothetical protein
VVSIHRTLDGRWAECTNPAACDSVFHFDNLTLAEAQAMPLHVLIPLLEVIRPPDARRIDGSKAWYDLKSEQATPRLILHSDYDLPAVIEPDGTLAWYRNGRPHREHDQPAVIKRNGQQEWFEHGLRHREGNKPAVIWPDGLRQYYRNGTPVDKYGVDLYDAILDDDTFSG